MMIPITTAISFPYDLRNNPLFLIYVYLQKQKIEDFERGIWMLQINIISIESPHNQAYKKNLKLILEIANPLNVFFLECFDLTPTKILCFDNFFENLKSGNMAKANDSKTYYTQIVGLQQTEAKNLKINVSVAEVEKYTSAFINMD